MKQYYEAHVTMVGVPTKLRPIVEKIGWKFSAIDGDIDLGEGLKCYATRQMNKRLGEEAVIAMLNSAAGDLEKDGAHILRRKVELVIFDNRPKMAREACNGACPECVG